MRSECSARQRLGVRQPSGALESIPGNRKAPEGWRSPKPCGKMIASFFSQPLAKILDDQGAGFARGHRRIVNHPRAESDHQWRGGALAVALIACGKVFIHAFGGAAFSALFDVGVE